VSAFLSALTEIGLAEGQNVGIEYRFSDDHADRLPVSGGTLLGNFVACMIGKSAGLPPLRRSVSDRGHAYGAEGHRLKAGSRKSVVILGVSSPSCANPCKPRAISSATSRGPQPEGRRSLM
jgi:hypothetical protein